MTNNDFCLDDCNAWGATEFWYLDSRNGYETMASMYLMIDHTARAAQIITCEIPDDLPQEESHIMSWCLLPEDTDFSAFGKFYLKELLPILEKSQEGYISAAEACEIEEEIEYLCQQQAPRHTIKYTNSIRSAYDDDLGMFSEAMSDVGINILTADLGNEETLTAIIDAIEMGDVILVDTQLGEMHLERSDFRTQLHEIQDELREKV